MIELITTHGDGRKICRKLKDGESYEVRGDEVSIEVNVVKKTKAKKAVE